MKLGRLAPIWFLGASVLVGVARGDNLVPNAPAAGIIDDSAPGWIWHGMVEYDDAQMQGGTAHIGGPGTYGLYTFQGTEAEVYCMAGPGISVDGRTHKMGRVKILLDGKADGSFDLARPDVAYGVRIYAAKNLTDTVHVLQIQADTGWAAIDYIEVDGATSRPTAAQATSTAIKSQVPAGYSRLGWAIPGTVQAENYDTGGPGTAYYVTSINGTANSYRSDGVDIETTSDTGGGYDLGWTSKGQCFRYSVNVAAAGTYTVTFRVAAGFGGGGSFHLANAGGDNLTGAVNVPVTGGWQTWANVAANVTLPSGPQVLELYQDSGGWNINWFSFTPGG